jgi:hypothetical protein
MMGNYHVRFLEERAAVMQLAYSTVHWGLVYLNQPMKLAFFMN